MEQWEQFIKHLLTHAGFQEHNVEIDGVHRHGSVFIYDGGERLEDSLPVLVQSVNHIAGVVAQKRGESPIFFDINNYRKERERLLGDLARAAARKAVATKETVTLPAMNSYERRLIHVELAAHPEVITESEGKGQERHVTIKIIDSNTVPLTKQVG